MQDSSLSVMRHAARGYLNAVKLCVSAMELDCTREEHIEFITDVITSSDKMELIMSEIAEYFEKHPATDEQSVNSSA